MDGRRSRRPNTNNDGHFGQNSPFAGPLPNFGISLFAVCNDPEPDDLVSDNEENGEDEKKKAFCRICLCNDRKLYAISPQNRSTFRDVLNRDMEEDDIIPQRVCFECNARMTSFTTFRTRALQTNSLLYTIIRPFANEPLDVTGIDRQALKLASTLQTKIYQADHADYHFVYCRDRQTPPKSNPSPNKPQETPPILELQVDDTHICSYTYSSEDNSKALPSKKAKKKKKDLKKVDKRCKPASEVFNSDIFDIKDLNQEEQMYEVFIRKISSNYKNSVFKCSECFKGFLDEQAYKGHMIRHTDQSGVYSCAICKIHFKKLQALRNHTTSHMHKFSCKRCNYVTFRRHAAKLHEEYHNGTKYVCPHCLDNFDKLSTYMSHVRIKHPSDIVCQLCGYSFVSAKGLGLHKKLKHRFDNHQVPTDGPWCTKCDVQFMNKEALERHAHLSAKHSDEIKPSKPLGRRNFNDQNSSKNKADDGRKKKPNISKPDSPIACEQCDMQLADPLSYYRHFRRVHPDKNRTNYPSMKSKSMCEVCGKMFQSLALLQDHSWTHTDSKQFKCSACDKQFVRKYRLIAHQRLHGASRDRHACSVCGKSFTTASNMQRHMVSHTGLKPFKCEMCGKCFKHASEKRVHVTYVHMKKPWPQRARPKKKDKQIQPESAMPVSDVQPVQRDIMLESKPLYYNMKM